MKTEGPTKSLLDEEFDRLDQPFDDRKPMSVASSHFNASFVQARLRQLGVFHSDHVSIAAEGFQLSKSKRFKFGKGIYSTPDVNIALLYAQTVTFKGERYKLVMQNRINPDNLVKICKDETGDGEYWISPSERDVRPYGFCVKKVD